MNFYLLKYLSIYFFQVKIYILFFQEYISFQPV